MEKYQGKRSHREEGERGRQVGGSRQRKESESGKASAFCQSEVAGDQRQGADGEHTKVEKHQHAAGVARPASGR